MAARLARIVTFVARRTILLPTVPAALLLGSLIAPPASGQIRPDCVTGCPGLGSAVDVTPHSGQLNTASGVSVTVSFTVTNVGQGYDTYSLAASCSGGCTWQSATTTGDMPPNTSMTVYVRFTSSGPNTTDYASLIATGSDCGGMQSPQTPPPGPAVRDDSAPDITCYTASGTYTVQVGPYPVITRSAPVVTTGSRAVVHNRQPIFRATFVGNGGLVDTTLTSLTWRGATVTTLARHNRGLMEWEVDSTHWLNVGDSAQAILTVCNWYPVANACTKDSIWVVLLNDQKPVIGFTGTPLEALGRQFGTGFGPGLSVSGADIETGLATPPYFSMGAARSAGLAYSTRQSYPRALVPVDVELPWPNGTATKIHVVLLDGATRVDSLVVTSPSCLTGAAHRCRVVLQGDFSTSSYATPTRKWLTVQVQVDSATTTQISTDSVEAVIVDRRTTWYGSGWWPTSVLKLVAAGGDRLLVGPTGTVSVYRGNGDSIYISPPGDFNILKKNGSGWTLNPRGSLAKLVFDSNGRLTNAIDQNGNADTLFYSGTSDQLTTIADPIGKRITLAYDGNAKLSTFTDPGGRVSRVAISGTTNQLTYDSIASPGARPFTSTLVYQTYPGTNTVVLTKRIGVILDTTIVTYDSTFQRRPTQVTVPAVPDENGVTQRPVIQYMAYERRGFGSLVSLDSTYVGVTDPRSNWTRSLLNRWGESRQTWDVLGTISRTSYTPEGLVLWSEGKVADSSRVYNSYDSLLRLAKTYIIRAVGDTLRLDTLFYDANFRVVKRLGVIADSTTWSYDSHGNLTGSGDAQGNYGVYVYLANGQRWKSEMPGNSSWQIRTYDPNWHNQATLADGYVTTLDSALYDGYGRDTAHVTKVRVQMNSGATPQWQWRRKETFYNIANQVDSVRSIRTDNCNDPCYTPGPFPIDTVHSQRVGYRYDRAGRDSLRLNDRGKATRYVIDRLGRVLSRHPWTDSMAVRDSMLYDVAGNVRKTITRRGDTLTTNFDSRNRDTLTAIPGVGTLRKAYAGPLDQLTRIWYDNSVVPIVDSIGGVNGAIAWKYDSHGRLLSDTSYTGATARVTRHFYDSKERDSSWTDPLGGNWFVRYEQARGYGDTLITPMGDTVTYTYDAKSRPVGPSIRGGGPLQSRAPVWDEGGTLDSLMGTEGTTPTFVTLKHDRKATTTDPQPVTAPAWTEQHGSGAALDSLQDSISYDGWGRVLSWVAQKNRLPVSNFAYQPDRDGNLHWTFTGGSQTYDSTTDRLLQAASSISTITDHYDRAGNLDTTRTDGTVTWVYRYNALNQLVAAYNSGTLVARYAYDALGRRIAKRVYSQGINHATVAYTRFVYRGASVAFEADSAGNPGLRYTWGLDADDLLALDDGTTHYYTTHDLLHSVRGLVRRDGTWVLSQRFDPYGVTLARDSNPVVSIPRLRYGWTGREFDAELGWYYFRARYYYPNHFRFVQEDPTGYGGGTNVYAYGNGNPLIGRDPEGTDYSYENQQTYWMGNSLDAGPGYRVDGASVPGGNAGYISSLMEQRARDAERAWVEAVNAAYHDAHLCRSLDCLGNASEAENVDQDYLASVYDAIVAPRGYPKVGDEIGIDTPEDAEQFYNTDGSPKSAVRFRSQGVAGRYSTESGHWMEKVEDYGHITYDVRYAGPNTEEIESGGKGYLEWSGRMKVWNAAYAITIRIGRLGWPSVTVTGGPYRPF